MLLFSPKNQRFGAKTLVTKFYILERSWTTACNQYLEKKYSNTIYSITIIYPQRMPSAAELQQK